jgi:hypothetical protein
MAIDKTELDRIDALLSRCFAVAEDGLETERRPLAILDCAEKLTRIKAKMIEVDEMHKRNMESMGPTGGTMTIHFSPSVKPARDSDD